VNKPRHPATDRMRRPQHEEHLVGGNGNGKNGHANGNGKNGHAPPALKIRTARQLAMEFPHLRPVVIDGLLRIGETANVIAPPKMGKSWLALQMALSVITERPGLTCPPAAARC
jgi:hypothetical protein